MNTNFKILEDLYNVVRESSQKLNRDDNRSTFRVATVQSVQTNTATIRFLGESFDVVGVPIKSGVTVVATNKVRVQSLTNGYQVASFVIDSVI